LLAKTALKSILTKFNIVEKFKMALGNLLSGIIGAILASLLTGGLTYLIISKTETKRSRRDKIEFMYITLNEIITKLENMKNVHDNKIENMADYIKQPAFIAFDKDQRYVLQNILHLGALVHVHIGQNNDWEQAVKLLMDVDGYFPKKHKFGSNINEIVDKHEKEQYANSNRDKLYRECSEILGETMEKMQNVSICLVKTLKKEYPPNVFKRMKKLFGRV
jgi:hypothetical protein